MLCPHIIWLIMDVNVEIQKHTQALLEHAWVCRQLWVLYDFQYYNNSKLNVNVTVHVKWYNSSQNTYSVILRGLPLYWEIQWKPSYLIAALMGSSFLREKVGVHYVWGLVIHIIVSFSEWDFIAGEKKFFFAKAAKDST